MDEPIFIVGVPRSGTTLLRMMLNSHSRIAIAPETHFFRLFWANRHKYGDLNKDNNFQKLWNDLTKCKYFGDLKLKNVQEIYEDLFNGKRSYKAIFTKLIKEYAKQHNKTRWGEKTPGHLEYVKTILSFYPHAKMIHIIRDPRDVALSLKKVPWGSRDVFPIARFWKRYINIPKKMKVIHSYSYLEIRYEDLVRSPEETLKVICNFINEKVEKNMFKFYLVSENYLPENEPWKTGCLKPLNSEYIGKWKTKLKEWEVKQIIATCSHEMLEKGYIENEPNFSFTDKLVLKSKNLQSYIKSFIRWIVRRILDN
ncbi:protein-tyrosine sulfotransferase [Candidatus Desulfofervidus auxilii]|uniref:Protein-tyrosine sulfotransferase n=1 Tax=Desulfofervidus auxilii TaxID=1621989 RepID=A0A7U4QL94_DESA2|nr:sulfotransferase [Candidatus Desulfofervidus auxilii]AMM41430.1 protein-tyrosine sulfotransferase [Candidatus Desulfofervidus auxilii]CAD7778179.1 Sulfotransferase family protein [Candidatus Methanoperedenaceae archaeon GB50]